jgi:hypothetical protein
LQRCAFRFSSAREEDEKEANRWQEELEAVKAFRQQQISKEEAKAEQFNVAGGGKGAWEF